MLKSSISLLWLDDHVELMGDQVDVVRQMGLRVETTGNLTKAMEKCKSDIFDLVVIDWQLPEGYGDVTCWLLGELQPDAIFCVYSLASGFSSIARPNGAPVFSACKMDTSIYELAMMLMRMIHQKRIGKDFQEELLQGVMKCNVNDVPPASTSIVHNNLRAIEIEAFEIMEISADLNFRPATIEIDALMQTIKALWSSAASLSVIDSKAASIISHEILNKTLRIEGSLLAVDASSADKKSKIQNIGHRLMHIKALSKFLGIRGAAY